MATAGDLCPAKAVAMVASAWPGGSGLVKMRGNEGELKTCEIASTAEGALTPRSPSSAPRSAAAASRAPGSTGVSRPLPRSPLKRARRRAWRTPAS